MQFKSLAIMLLPTIWDEKLSQKPHQICVRSSWLAVTSYDMKKMGRSFNFLNGIEPKGGKGIYLVYFACLRYSSYHCHQEEVPSLTESAAVCCSCIFVTFLLRNIFKKHLAELVPCVPLNAYYSVFYYTQLQSIWIMAHFLS